MNTPPLLPRLVAVLLLGSACVAASAQSDLDAKAAILDGIDAYRANTGAADSLFALGTTHSELAAVAEYNLGRAFVQSGDTARAQSAFRKAIGSTEDRALKSSAWHNLGNLSLQQSELSPAIQAYKQALRENPENEEARYNLAYAMRLAQQQQDQNQDQQQDQDQQDQNQDQQQDQDQDQDQQDQNQDDQQNQDQQDQDSEQQQDEQQGDGEQQQDEQQGQDGEQQQDEQQGDQQQESEAEDGEGQQGEQPQQQPVEGQISPEDMERILESLERNEAAIQAKLQQQRNGGERRTIEKDW